MAKKSEEDLSESTFNDYRTGLIRDLPDERDLVRVYGSEDIPSSDEHPIVDLRKYVRKVYHQGNLGCCTANVICAAYELELKKEAEPHGYHYYHFDPSRLFLYYNSRVYKGVVNSDNGASLRDTLKAINDSGVCREELWPYKIQYFKKKPSKTSYDDAKGKTITKYESLGQQIHQLRACLRKGFAFAFGYHVYRNFVIKKDGLMPMPSAEDIKAFTKTGGHCGLCVGYNDNTGCFTILNSWGETFGDKGYFYMPYDFIAIPLHAFNFWKIEKAVENIEIVVIP